MSLARTGTQAGPIEMELAVGRWVRSRMIPGDLYRPLPHSAFVEVTLTPLRLWEGNFAAWGRERPSWPSVLVEGVKVHKSQVEWACSVFADSPPPLSATWLLYSHPCLLFVRFLPACCLFVCLSVFLYAVDCSFSCIVVVVVVVVIVVVVVVCLFVWLVGWLAGWLGGWLVGWLGGWFLGWLVVVVIVG